MPPEWRLPPLKTARKTGTERFNSAGRELPISLLEFWQWSVSDLVSNATRGRLAEFIVAKALRLPTDGVRNEWQAYDLTTRNGTRVEVKSAAYIQAWHQKRPSRIAFSIAESQYWDPATGTIEKVAARQADVYVFALLNHKHKDGIDPMDLDQWQFYTIAKERLNQRFGKCRSISLASLEKVAGPPVSFAELGALQEWHHSTLGATESLPPSIPAVGQ